MSAVVAKVNINIKSIIFKSFLRVVCIFNIHCHQLLPLIALWSHAQRVGTTFALDWSKAREAKVPCFNLNFRFY